MSNCQEIFRAGVVLVSACAQVGPDFLWPESAANEQWPGQAREEFLLSSASASYAAFMIKVASMGQQAGVDQSRQAGKSLLLSTVIGGIGAIVGWQVLSIWLSLLIYVLLIGLGGLIMGPRIFAGAGMHPAGARHRQHLLHRTGAAGTPARLREAQSTQADHQSFLSLATPDSGQGRSYSCSSITKSVPPTRHPNRNDRCLVGAIMCAL